MDQFFREYEVAQKLGFTIEQFIDVWKTRSVSRQQNEDNYGEMQTLGGDLFQHQSPQNQQLFEGLAQDLHRNFQYLQSQQDQQWQQLHIRLDQMIREFRCSFESLSKLISNITELNADSIKKHFRDELGLLKQDIMQVVKTNHVGNEPGHAASEMSFQQGGKAQVKAPHNVSGFDKANIDMYANMNNHNVNKPHDVGNQGCPETVSTLHQIQNHISEFSFDQVSQIQQNALYTAAIKGAIAGNKRLGKDIRQETSELSFDQVSQIQQNTSYTTTIQRAIAPNRILGKEICQDSSELSFGQVSNSLQNTLYIPTGQGTGVPNTTLGKAIHQDNSQLSFDQLLHSLQNTSSTTTLQDAAAANKTLGKAIHQDTSELSFDQVSQIKQNTSYTTTIQGAAAPNRTLGKDVQQDAAVISYAKAVSQSTHSHNPHTANNSKLSGRPVNPSTTTLSESIEATGSYAEAVSNQLKQMRSSPASSISDRQRSDSLSSIRSGSMSARNDYSLSAVEVDSGQQMFTIHNSQQFSVSNKPFLSEIMYSGGEPCRARVRINIEASGFLVVRIHISRGDYDDKHKWPLWLSGFGYIWNITSRRRTQIWQLHPVLCQKPLTEKETIFTADVCLTTLRGSYPKIKYQKLVDKHYAEDNRLTFVWDLRADLIGKLTPDKKQK